MNGVKPGPDQERQADTMLTVWVPASMAVNLSRRVKEKRAKEPRFSRNDLLRGMVRDYFARHPFKTPESGS